MAEPAEELAVRGEIVRRLGPDRWLSRDAGVAARRLVGPATIGIVVAREIRGSARPDRPRGPTTARGCVTTPPRPGGRRSDPRLVPRWGRRSTVGPVPGSIGRRIGPRGLGLQVALPADFDQTVLDPDRGPGGDQRRQPQRCGFLDGGRCRRSSRCAQLARPFTPAGRAARVDAWGPGRSDRTAGSVGASMPRRAAAARPRTSARRSITRGLPRASRWSLSSSGSVRRPSRPIS